MSSYRNRSSCSSKLLFSSTLPRFVLSVSNSMASPPSPRRPDAVLPPDADPMVQALESKPDLQSILQDAGASEQIEKHNRYMAFYSWRLKGKYFSKKALNGVNVFDHETVIDDEIIKSSRWPCTRLFADPIQNLENKKPPLSSETSATPNKKQTPSKNC